ncbi:MAG: hypothetical protein ACD_79C00467G0007 [uncultured bacterium]|nr:MAG: hypothetical protein ACD_79C00467G0007 [uncultured bacterium]
MFCVILFPKTSYVESSISIVSIIIPEAEFLNLKTSLCNGPPLISKPFINDTSPFLKDSAIILPASSFPFQIS